MNFVVCCLNNDKKVTSVIQQNLSHICSNKRERHYQIIHVSIHSYTTLFFSFQKTFYRLFTFSFYFHFLCSELCVDTDYRLLYTMTIHISLKITRFLSKAHLSFLLFAHLRKCECVRVCLTSSMVLTATSVAKKILYHFFSLCEKCVCFPVKWLVCSSGLLSLSYCNKLLTDVGGTCSFGCCSPENPQLLTYRNFPLGRSPF